MNYTKSEIGNIAFKLTHALQKLIILRRPGYGYFGSSKETIPGYIADDFNGYKKSVTELCEEAQDMVWELYEYSQEYDHMNEYEDIWVSYNFMKKLAEHPNEVETGEIDWWINTVMPDLTKRYL